MELPTRQENLPALPRSYGIFQRIIRPILFMQDPESAHDFVARICGLLWKSKFGRNLTQKIYSRPSRENRVRIGNLELRNPVGLAAGFDKNCNLLPGLDSLGFGFVEIGTVTPRPQAGNARPRIRRESARRALVNSMGFPNDGMEVICERLKKARESVNIPIGVNIGKNRDTPNSEAVNDYEMLLLKFMPHADYFAVNISSPNTPGLKTLQSLEFVSQLGKKILSLRISQPVFLKLSPDISFDDLKDICSLCGTESGKPYTGLILTNTVPTDLGGMSGYPIKRQSFALLVRARSLLPANVPIISVGGIETAADVNERLKAGASAVQIYTSLIYQGPSVVRNIQRSSQP